MKLRLHGTPAECDLAARRLADVFQVVSVSQPYPDRGTSVLVRAYLEVRLDPADPSRSAGPPPGNPQHPSRPADEASGWWSR